MSARSYPEAVDALTVSEDLRRRDVFPLGQQLDRHSQRDGRLLCHSRQLPTAHHAKDGPAGGRLGGIPHGG